LQSNLYKTNNDKGNLQMTDDQASGMWWGLFIGDAMGVPLEFTQPNYGKPVTTFTSGGVHKAAKGEYSDDGAMALAIADAYITQGRFCGSTIQQNFIDWSETGVFGTREGEPAWDIGITVNRSLGSVRNIQSPYAGSTMADTSGNGCIMRMAPCIIWNRNNLSAAIGESVAQALLTHGSSDCITYTAALAHELWEGKALTQYDHLRNRSINNSGYVADTYASAWHSVKTTKSFHAAIVDAINRGEDADTVGAVTGMIAGRIYGIDFNISNLQIINNKRIDEFHQLFINRHN
jgi:ADP-ribosyl-[dinitrogen reductase] hydrolase